MIRTATLSTILGFIPAALVNALAGYIFNYHGDIFISCLLSFWLIGIAILWQLLQKEEAEEPIAEIAEEKKLQTQRVRAKSA